MIGDLQDLLDVSALPLGARIAQVVLAGTAVSFVASRAINARADLMLVVEMVHGDLADDVRTGLLPALDPQIIQLERALTSARRLAPAAIAAQAVSRGRWWDPAPAATSVLTPEQQNRIDGYVSQLDASAAAYRIATRPWWRFSSAQAPRHFHGNQRPRILHASATPQRKLKRAPRVSGEPAREDRQRNLVFDGPVPAVTATINRSRGVGPQRETHDVEHHIELGQRGLSDVLHR